MVQSLKCLRLVLQAVHAQIHLFILCEKVGEIEYSTHGVIGPKTLSFYLSRRKFDRMGLHTEWIDNGLINKVMKFTMIGCAVRTGFCFQC